MTRRTFVPTISSWFSLRGSLLLCLALLGLAPTMRSQVPFELATSITDGTTPKGIEAGTPAGSFALSGFDTISPFTGKVNFRLPLRSIGGRGESGYTVMLDLREENWTIVKEEETDVDSLGQVFTTVLSVVPEQVYWIANEPGFSPGVMAGRSAQEVDTCLTTGFEDPYVSHQLTRLTFVSADGSETELVDSATLGKPKKRTTLCSGSESPSSRGTEFVSIDGSALTFVSDSPVLDDFTVQSSPAPFSTITGNLYFPNGARYRVVSGRVEQIYGRNGNETSIIYAPGFATRVATITDPTGRIVTFTYEQTDPLCPNGDVTSMSYDGYDGTQRRVDICYQPMSETNPGLAEIGPVLRSGSTIMKGSELFTELSLSLIPSDTPYDAVKPHWVRLPNQNFYIFQYNSYGEIARVRLPTGGAVEYDWVAGATGNPIGGAISERQVYRRVAERRVCPSNESGTSCPERATYSAVGVADLTVTVKHEQQDSMGAWATLRTEVHSLEGIPTESSFAAISYPSWKRGKELSMTISDPANGNLQRIDSDWEQKNNATLPWCSSAPGAFCLAQTPENRPSNDPRLIRTTTTLLDASPNRVSKQEFEYDDFNNRTETREYAYGSGSAGGLARVSATSFMATADFVNHGQASSPGAHLRRLVKESLLCSSSPCTQAASVSRTFSSYDQAPLADDGYGTVANHVSPSGKRGNLTTVLRDMSDSAQITSTRTYDILGNIVSLTDPKLQTTSISYTDSYVGSVSGSFPPSATFARPTLIERGSGGAYQILFKYDWNLGAVVTATDFNNVDTTVTYADTLDRPVDLVLAANDTSVRGRTRFVYDDTPADGANHPKVTTQTDHDSYQDPSPIEAVSVFDGLGRRIRSHQREDGSNCSATNQAYDALGRVTKTTNPFRETSCNPDNVLVSGNVTTTEYDGLGRGVKVTRPDGSDATTDYAGDVTTETDEADNARQLTSDVLGRLLKVIEDPGAGGLGYVTDYAYDLLDNLTRVDQQGDAAVPTQVRTFAYDRLSRLVCASNPESRTTSSVCTVSGPTSGVDRFEYDDNGNLIRKVDARDVVTCNSSSSCTKMGALATDGYDILNRLTRTQYSDSTPEVFRCYDGLTSTGGACSGSMSTPNTGLLTAVGSSVSVMELAYDQRGRISSSTQTTGGDVYPFLYSYFRDGLPQQQTYPGGFAVTYSYDGAGRAKTGAAGAKTYVSNITYEAHGAPDVYSLGNGVSENVDYNNRLQPTQIRAALGAELLKLNLVYNPAGQTKKNNGNIHEQKITVTGLPSGFVTQAYAYDKVNRITSVTEGGWSRSYHYDAFGNRAMQGSVPSPALAPLCVLDGVMGCATADPDVADRPAYDANTNRFNTDWAKYDNAGNVTWHKDPIGAATRQWSAAYNAVNKQTRFCDGGVDPCTSGAATGSYSYDGSGNRVEKMVGSVTTTYVYDASERLAAEYSSQAPTGLARTLFRTIDHLGSTRLVTDAGGGVVSRRDFFPFGEEISANSTFGNRQLVLDGQTATTYNASAAFTQKFTGKERDDESGLDYFGARYYAASIGRFTGVDPVNAGARLLRPQSWNGYSYVDNRPLSRIDRDGRQALPVPVAPPTVPPPGPVLVPKPPPTGAGVRVGARVLMTAGVVASAPVVGVVIALTVLAQPTSSSADRRDFVGPPAPRRRGRNRKKDKPNEGRQTASQQRGSSDLAQEREDSVAGAMRQSGQADRESNRSQEDGQGKPAIADKSQKRGKQLNDQVLKPSAGVSASEMADLIEAMNLGGDPMP